MADDIFIEIGDIKHVNRTFSRNRSRSSVILIGRSKNRVVITFKMADRTFEYLVADFASDILANQLESSLTDSTQVIYLQPSDSVVSLLHYGNEVANTFNFPESYVRSFARAIGRYPNLVSAPGRSPRLYLCLLIKSST